MTDASELIDLTADIVSAYVGNNSVSVAGLPALIRTTFVALSGAATPAAPVEEAKAPAVSIKKSITDDFLICLEDGRKFKSLKRHLRTKYGLSPEDYRTKWGLPKTYPMVAPAYAAARSNLAKQMGLGLGGRGETTKAAVKAAPPVNVAVKSAAAKGATAKSAPVANVAPKKAAAAKSKSTIA